MRMYFSFAEQSFVAGRAEVLHQTVRSSSTCCRNPHQQMCVKLNRRRWT